VKQNNNLFLSPRYCSTSSKFQYAFALDYCEHMIDMCPCVELTMSDCQEMIKIWLNLETNHGVSMMLCSMFLGCVGAQV
jgi:hypothetical protein